VLDPILYNRELEGIGSSGLPFSPAFPWDAGIDLRAAEDTWINPGVLGKIRLGVAIEVPYGSVGWITGRSTSVLEMGLFIADGKIDAGYRGEIHAFALTIGGKPTEVKRGDRIVQLVVVQIVPTEGWKVVSELSDSDRSTSGLGSSGRR